MDKEKQKYQDFCKDLTERYLKELSGEGENSNYIYNMRPTKKIVIGILDSNIQNDESTRYTSIPIVKVQKKNILKNKRLKKNKENLMIQNHKKKLIAVISMKRLNLF